MLQRVVEGDVNALGALFDQMARPVYSLVMHLLQSHDQAEDIVEATFWHAWQDSGKLLESDHRGWLLTTGRTLALEHPRSRSRNNAGDEGASDEQPREYPLNPGRAAGIRSRLLSRASADTERRVVTVPSSAASRVKPPAAKSAAPPPSVREHPVERERIQMPFGGMAVVAGIAALVAIGAVIQMMRANSEAESLRATIQIQRDTAADTAKAPASAADQDKIVASVTGPDVKVISLTHYGARGAVGKMFWNRESNTWTLVTYSIRQPHPDKVFQVWLSTAKGTLSGGTFVPDGEGRALVYSTNTVARDDLYSITVTEEPTGGAPAPTGPAVIAGAP